MPAHDWFGIGAVAYYLLTGRAPFVGDTRAELVEAVRAGRVPPVSEISPQTPADLAALVDHLLSGRPGGAFEQR